MDSYDYAADSTIRCQRIKSLESLLSKRDVSLMDFLEAGCSMAYYFADFLGNSGIRAMLQEMENLKRELDNNDETSGDANEDFAGKDAAVDDMEVLYNDSLTGLRKWVYFDDFILPVYYDSNNRYNGDVPRFVFCCEISNLTEINRASGNDTGDIVFREFASAVNSAISSRGGENMALRGAGGMITGFMTGITQTEAAENLHKILGVIKMLTVKNPAGIPIEIIFNAGVYREWKGSDVYRNIEIAKKIMLQLNDGIDSHVGFLRNQDYVVTDQDIDRKGYLRESLISVLV